MTEELLIIGAGALGRESLQYAKDSLGVHSTISRIKGFLDDTVTSLEDFGVNVPVLGSIESYEPVATDRMVVAIADQPARRKVIDLLTEKGAKFTNIIHPRAYVAASAKFGTDCIVAPFALVAVDCRIESHVILNTYASIGHDSVVEDGCVFSPYAVVNGHVRVRADVFLGTGAVVTPRNTVGRRARIAAGSVLYRNAPDDALAQGNPAKVRVFPSG